MVFIDTNILVYATLPSSPWYKVAQDGLTELATSGTTGAISPQILREYYVSATRQEPGKPSPPVAPALANVARFRAAYMLLEDTEQVVQALYTLAQSVPIGGRQIHDANIVATMLAYGIGELYTHNMAHFARFADLITIRPLVAPAQL